MDLEATFTMVFSQGFLSQGPGCKEYLAKFSIKACLMSFTHNKKFRNHPMENWNFWG
jgi:hypothetical protein